MSAPLIQLEQLAVGYDGKLLLNPIDLSVAAGRVVALIGPSGSGKSTLLRTVAGLIDPAAGRVRLQGREPAAHGWPNFRRKVVHVAQQPAMLEDTVQANLRRPFEYRSAEGITFDRALAEDALQAVGLEPGQLEEPARRLSVGQQQRVALVRAMLLDPHVLLLDEPTSPLDDASAALVEDAVRARTDRHASAVIIATHRVERVDRFCDERVELKAVAQKA